MVEITTIANQLNKDHDYVMKLCEQQDIEIQYDSQGMWLYDCDAEKLVTTRTQKHRHVIKFRGVECTEVQRIMIGDEAMQNVLDGQYRQVFISSSVSW